MASQHPKADDPDASRYFPSTGEASHPSIAPPPYTALSEQKGRDAKTEPSASIPSASTVTTTTALPTYEELKIRLEEAEAKLREYSERETGVLRYRGDYRGDRSASSTTSEKGPAGTTVRQGLDASPGVPVRIVAVLCLISFLMAYFFF